MENGRECAEGSQSLFLNLPDDVIYSILNACDISTLAVLCQVCRRLNQLVNQQCVWVWKIREYSVVHDTRLNNRARSAPFLMRVIPSCLSGCHRDMINVHLDFLLLLLKFLTG